MTQPLARRIAIALVVAIGFVVASFEAIAQEADQGSIWLDVIEPNIHAYNALLEAGRVAGAEGRTDDAIASLREAVELRPDRPQAAFAELSLLVEVGRYDEAVERAQTHRDRLQDEDEDAESILLFLESIALTRLGRYADAADLLVQAVRYREELPEAELYYGNLAELLVAQGELEQALMFFQQAVAEQPRYLHARVGLAATLELLGRQDEARRHLVFTVTEDPSLSFLDESGVFYVPNGQDMLYRALLEEARGNVAEATRALTTLAATDAGRQLPPGPIDALRGRLGEPPIAVEAVALPPSGCSPSLIAVTNDRARMAVLCDSGSIHEGPLQPADPGARARRVSWRTLTTPTLTGGYGWYDISDMAYTADAGQLRLLYSTNRVEAIDLATEPPELAATITYDSPDLQSMYFVRDAERVLFTGTYTAGFQLEDWDTTPVVANLNYTGSSWIYHADMADDEQTLLTFDGYTISMYDAPAWTQPRTMTFSDPYGYYTVCLTRGGDAIATVDNGLLVLHDSGSMQPIELAALPSSSGEAWNPNDVGIRLLDSAGDDLIVIGRYGEALLIDVSR